MATIDQMAYDAGFRKAEELMTCSKPHPASEIGWMKIKTALLPDGWWGLKNDYVAILMGPEGQIINLPDMAYGRKHKEQK